jgi:hypothetical protein
MPLIDTLIDVLRSRASLHLEMLAMRQQLAMIADRDCKRIRFRSSERLFWVWLYSLWPTCLQTLMIFKPDTLVRWHRKGFRLYWTWKSRRRPGGRPAIDPDVRELIRTMSRNNIGWGAPRIHGELQMLGIQVSESTVARYMVRHQKPPSQTWRTFLDNHVERLIGSIRRECLDHVIVFNERHLRRLLNSYAAYYHEARTHLSLDKQCPMPRLLQYPDQGNFVAIPHVGGLHHEYRRAA